MRFLKRISIKIFTFPYSKFEFKYKIYKYDDCETIWFRYSD